MRVEDLCSTSYEVLDYVLLDPKDDEVESLHHLFGATWSADI